MKSAEDYWFEHSIELPSGRFMTEANFKDAIRKAQKECLEEAISKSKHILGQWTVEESILEKLIDNLK